MKYDFDERINRRNNNSDKWTCYEEGVLPMWIADMDFKVSREIVEGLEQLSRNAIYGYSKPRPERLLDAITYRMKKLYNWTIEPSSIVLLPGLVTGMNLAGAMAKRRNTNANYIVNTPIYPPMLEIGNNQEIKCIDVPLKREVRNHKELYYTMDLKGIENSINENTELFVLCQPQNPTGRVFNKDELQALEEILDKHNIVVLSDEIHAEILLEDKKNVPYALLNKKTRERTITLFAASKTFNIAGLNGGFAIIENELLRKEYETRMKGLVPRMNIYAMKGTELAFDYGDEWLGELLPYLKENRDYIVETLSQIEGLKYTIPEATFLIWIDFTDTSLGENAHKILLENQLALNNGVFFGQDSAHVRLNFAAPRTRITTALKIIQTVAS